MGRDATAFVFTAPQGGFWRYSQFYRRRWVKIRQRCEADGLPLGLTIHGLRHSLLTFLAAEGMSLTGLRSVAGHKHAMTTLNLYTHATTRHHPAMRHAVDAFVGVLPHLGRTVAVREDPESQSKAAVP